VRLEQMVNELAAQGRRVLAAAQRSNDSMPLSADEAETDLALVGFIGIVDPPRPEARFSISQCRTAGIRPVMITGDHQGTAIAIAKELSLWTEDLEVIDGQ